MNKMGIESLLLCGMAFGDGSDFSIIGTKESLHQKANDVGTSRFQTFLADPQPAPDYVSKLEIRQGIISTPVGNAMNYTNQNKELLGGIVQLNPAELATILNRYNKEK